MFEEFDARSQTKVLRDTDHVARTLSHPRYIATDARTPQLAAREYLARYGELLGLQEEELKHLFAPTEQEPTVDEVEYRLLSEKHQFDLTTVTFYQTHFGLPVREAGVSITLKTRCVLSGRKRPGILIQRSRGRRRKPSPDLGPSTCKCWPRALVSIPNRRETRLLASINND